MEEGAEQGLSGGQPAGGLRQPDGAPCELAKSCVKLGKKRGLPIVVEYVDKPGRSKTMELPI